MYGLIRVYYVFVCLFYPQIGEFLHKNKVFVLQKEFLLLGRCRPKRLKILGWFFFFWGGGKVNPHFPPPPPWTSMVLILFDVLQKCWYIIKIMICKFLIVSPQQMLFNQKSLRDWTIAK